MSARLLLAFIGSVAFVVAGCSQTKFDGNPGVDGTPGPGQGAWEHDSIECDTDADCGQFEVCIANVCQMQGCGEESYPSAPPLGIRHYLALKKDLVVIAGAAIDGYHPTLSSIVRPTGVDVEWTITGSELQDIAGGNLFGTRPESLAVAVKGSDKLNIISPTSRFTLSLGFNPIAVAVGDLDADGLDEAIALGSSGQISTCNARSRSCTKATFAHSWTGTDVAVGDVDGDGFDEVVVLGTESGKRGLFVWNPNAAATQESVVVKGFPSEELYRITVGDLNGDAVAEVIGLTDDGYGGIPNDDVYVYSLNGGLDKLGTREVPGSSKDVAAADFTGDHKAELAVLDDGDTVEVYHATGSNPGSLSSAFGDTLPGTTAATRLAVLDIDGDSPSTKLIDGPKLVSGQVVPIAVLAFPPFSRTYSDGVAGMSLGRGSDTSHGTSESVSLGLGVSAGYGFDFPGDIFGLSGSISIGRDLSTSHSTSEGVSVGSSYSLTSNVQYYGTEYTGVVVAVGCFAAYTYQVDDPANDTSGGHGEPFTVYVPVGGQTALWSNKRWNALAQTLGGLPVIDVAHNIGDPLSYPTAISTLAGAPIDDEDLVFKEPPTYRTSEIGQVGWSLAASSSETNGTSMSTSISLSATLKIGGGSVGGSVSRGWSQGNSVSVGSSISFSGSVPGLPDKPSTPEDEYMINAYSFTPYVYREYYTDAAGEQTAYYVLMYAVRR